MIFIATMQRYAEWGKYAFCLACSWSSCGCNKCRQSIKKSWIEVSHNRKCNCFLSPSCDLSFSMNTILTNTNPTFLVYYMIPFESIALVLYSFNLRHFVGHTFHWELFLTTNQLKHFWLFHNIRMCEGLQLVCSLELPFPSKLFGRLMCLALILWWPSSLNKRLGGVAFVDNTWTGVEVHWAPNCHCCTSDDVKANTYSSYLLVEDRWYLVGILFVANHVSVKFF